MPQDGETRSGRRDQGGGESDCGSSFRLGLVRSLARLLPGFWGVVIGRNARRVTQFTRKVLFLAAPSKSSLRSLDDIPLDCCHLCLLVTSICTVKDLDIHSLVVWTVWRASGGCSDILLPPLSLSLGSTFLRITPPALVTETGSQSRTNHVSF